MEVDAADSDCAGSGDTGEKLGVNAIKGTAPPMPRSVAVNRPAAILRLLMIDFASWNTIEREKRVVDLSLSLSERTDG